MVLYICSVKGVFLFMFSPEFMKYLINYQKSEFAPENTQKEIKFKNNRFGKLAKVFITIK